MTDTGRPPEALLDAPLHLLAPRIRGIQELRGRLLRRGFPPDQVAGCLSWLEERGLLDDETFSVALARDRLRLSPRSPSLVRKELIRRGISPAVAERALARVLEEEGILEAHLLARDKERPTLLGLAFEPARRGRIPDIQGTLWLEAGTAELQFIEYSYTWEPWVEARGVARGRIDFERLPSGGWIVPRWWIRMPRMARDYTVTHAGARLGVRVAGILEQGGEVLRATSLDGEQVVVMSEAPPGVLAGRVWDSLAHQPLSQAGVHLSGTPFSAVTDSAGRFSLTGVPEGVYTAAFTHPRLDTLQLTLPGVEVEIEGDSVTSVELGIPFAENLVDLLCPGDAFPDSTSVLLGSVRAGVEKIPVEDARVTVRWEVVERFSPLTIGLFLRTPWKVEAHTDSKGWFIACGVPVGYPLTVQAFHGDELSEPQELYVRSDGSTRVELVVGHEGGPEPGDGADPRLLPPNLIH